MSSVPSKPSILASDIHADDSHCHVTIVQPESFSYALLNISEMDEVLTAFESGTVLMDILNEDTSFADCADFISLTDIQSMEWQKEDANLLVNFHDVKTNRSVKMTVACSDADTRSDIIAAIQQEAGVPFKQSLAKAKIWETLQIPLFCGGITSAICLLLGISGLADDGETVEVRITGRRRTMKLLVMGLYNTIGPVGIGLPQE